MDMGGVDPRQDVTMSQTDRHGMTMRARGQVDALSEALDALPEGITVFDADGGLLFWNGRYAEVCAHPPGFLRVGLPS